MRKVSCREHSAILADDLEELITSIDQILMGSAQVSLAPLQLGAAGALNVNLDMELRKQAAASRGSAGSARIRKLNAEIELSQAGTVDLLVSGQDSWACLPSRRLHGCGPWSRRLPGNGLPWAC